MISIIILVRNARAFAPACLRSVLSAMQQLGLERDVEYLLIDDFSDADHGIVDLFHSVRARAAAPVKIIRFKQRRHFTYGVACGLSLARGEHVLFISHDMLIAPSCIRMLRELSAAEPALGILRCRSEHMDGAMGLAFRPNPPPRSIDQVRQVADIVAKQETPDFSETSFLIADSMFVSRAVIDRIGVFDTSFFGFLGDIDYGIRAQRAGFRVGVAMKAWLHHFGSAYREQAVRANMQTHEEINAENLRDLQIAYDLFRQKWDPSLPPVYDGLAGADIQRFLVRDTAPGSDYVAPLTIDPEIVEVIA